MPGPPAGVVHIHSTFSTVHIQCSRNQDHLEQPLAQFHFLEDQFCLSETGTVGNLDRKGSYDLEECGLAPK